MDKGYDTNWFSEFVVQKRGNLFFIFTLEGGTDVDVWDFEELKQVVYEF